MKKKLLLPLIFSTVFSLCGCSLVQENKENSNKDNNAEYEFNKKAAVSFSFDDATNSRTEENVSHEKYRIKYVFSEDNADKAVCLVGALDNLSVVAGAYHKRRKNAWENRSSLHGNDKKLIRKHLVNRHNRARHGVRNADVDFV